MEVLLCVILCPKRVPEFTLCVGYLQVKNTTRSELMCMVGSRNSRPLRIICFLIWEGPCIHRLGRRCNVAWPRDFLSFWNKILSFYPENIAKSGGKVEQKMKRNELVWKTRGCVFDRTFDSFLWAHLWPAPWNPWHGVMTPRQSLVWFSFSGRFFNNYTSWIPKWPKNPWILLESEFEKVCFDI